MKILVIDDEPFIGKLLVRQLAVIGLDQVTMCECAHDALTLLDADAQSIDLIFCDLQMPVMDGVEFVRHLVQMRFEGALVLVSGEEGRILQTAEKLARAHKLKVLGALHKPVFLQQLQHILARGAIRTVPSPRAAHRTYGGDEVRRAIDAGELTNYYQPKVEIPSAKVVGVETLVRWRHPEDGMVFPDQFVHVAEENGLIDDLTRTVLQTALRHARRWKDEGFSLHLAVNVSMDNLGALEFPDFVEQAALAAGVSVTSLILEVTESRLMKDSRAPMDVLTRLRLKRVGLSIDDFGTGHSTLTQLRDIPFNEMKVDRSFVHGACRDAALRPIVEASLGMARQLGLRTVGEGVEDRDDWDFLAAAGCDLAQGWFVAKPMPAAELSGWIADWELRRPELMKEQL